MTNQAGTKGQAEVKTPEELIELARSMQCELPGVQGMRKSRLEPLTYVLAEFRYLGLSKQCMYEFVKKAGITISYPAMCDWTKRHLGENSGETSKAARILRQGLASGEFISPYLSQQQQPVAGTQAASAAHA